MYSTYVGFVIRPWIFKIRTSYWAIVIRTSGIPVDLWDNRRPRWQPRHYQNDVASNSKAVAVPAVVRYPLLEENRRQRIGYENETPIHYEIFRKEISLQEGKGAAYE